MPQLFALTGTDLGRSFRVGHGATLGRSPACTAALGDRSISRKHAHIECAPDGTWHVVDDGSRNGLFVDNQRVERAQLADGQEFRLGELVLRFRLEQSEETAPELSTAADFEDEIQIEDVDEIHLEEDPAPPPRPAAFSEPTAFTPAPAAVRASQPAKPTPRQAAGIPDRKRDSVAGRGSTERVLQYHRVESRSGLFAADLAQLPVWLRYLLYLIALALAVGLAWLAFRSTTFLRSQVTHEDPGAYEVDADL